ncbi:LysR family transcriptional regulator [Pseudorhodoferax sp.]|uniref:LysR family transcriptional regulator n=1 Tax=Pseudorhodoferax sp. TaxID=1993553 RepID=UPI002DD68DB2|nr:LysR family transcriptional regulator [Pseudorhodoferax sp.]
MDLRQVRYFVAVAEKGSISAAAGVLHVAQSAVSRQMRLLEESMGGPLFHRSIAGAELTDSGLMFLERARFILREVESATHDVSNFNRGMRGFHHDVRGTVRVSSAPTVGQAIYGGLALHFRERFPQVRLELAESWTEDALHRLSAGSIDMAIVSDPGNQEHIQFTPLMQQETAVFCLPGSKLAGRPSVHARELRKLPIIISQGLRHSLEAQHGAMQPVLQIDGTEVAAQLTRDSIGVAVMPSSVLRTSSAWQGLTAVPVRQFSVTRMLAVAKGRPVSLAAKAFQAAMQEQVARCIGDSLFLPP